MGGVRGAAAQRFAVVGFFISKIFIFLVILTLVSCKKKFELDRINESLIALSRILPYDHKLYF
jgi:hypothetical protein